LRICASKARDTNPQILPFLGGSRATTEIIGQRYYQNHAVFLPRKGALIMTENRHEPVTDPASLQKALNRIREAQKAFADFSQEQVDRIFFGAARAAAKMRIPLAKMAVEETGMGVVEDKVIKNLYASEYIYNAYKDEKTCGVIEDDPV
jgi:acyl-CoA reductase-like NAD-dependent aldehyde dehydrogenase